MPGTGFDPVRHGFAFSNSFVNVLGTLPGFGQITTRGRCGGMAYAALDYYFQGLKVPETDSLPPDGTPLADYIYARLLDSFLVPSASKFISWTLYADHATWFYKGVTRWTKEDELPNVMAGIDQGLPQVLGLVTATDLTMIGDDHQVVAHAYDDDGAGDTTVHLYDNRFPGEDVRLASTAADPHWTLTHAGGTEDWRGFFVQGYPPKTPDFAADGTLLKEQSAPEVFVVYGGGKFWIPSPEELTALGFSWDRVRMVPDGSLEWVAGFPADGTLLKERSQPEVYVMAGGHRHRITSPEALEARGYSWDRVRTVADGGLAACPRGEDFGVPAAPQPPQPWSSGNGGSFTTSDGDDIHWAIDRTAVATDVVEFELELGTGVTWRKELNLPDGEGNSWDIVAEGAGGSGKESLWAGQVQNGQSLTFRKAKLLGLMTEVHTLDDLGGLTPGSRVTFTWVKE